MNREFFVGWGTLALINAGLAQSKNRSGLGWFLGSIILGPIATLVIVLLERAKTGDETTKPQPAPEPSPGPVTPRAKE